MAINNNVSSMQSNGGFLADVIINVDLVATIGEPDQMS